MTARSCFNRGHRLAAALGAAAALAPLRAAEPPPRSPLDAYLAEAAPRRFAELTPAEREALLRDPRLRDYLAASASPAPAPAEAPAAIVLTPGEMLRRQPWRAPVPAP
ncbi:MAG TPA: hypothetical protein VHV47_01335 [Opitutaceae bacterium]|jgi:hypothetical protein|nr:hypothetical protein [Opitutaceae bacterium]